MKFIILITVLSLLLFSDTENFTITDSGNLELSKVHTTELSTTNLHIAIKTKLKGEEISSNTFIAQIKNYQLEFEELGYKKMSTPIVAQGKINFELLIQTKEGKYKVTARQIKSITPIDDSPTDMELFAIKKGNYKSLFTKHLAKILEYNLNKKTILVPENTDW